MDTARIKAALDTNDLVVTRDDLRSIADSLRGVTKEQIALRVKNDSPYRERGINHLAQATIDIRNALYEIELALDCI